MFDDERNDCYEEDVFPIEDGDDRDDEWDDRFDAPVDEDEEMERILWDEDLESDLFGDD